MKRPAEVPPTDLELTHYHQRVPLKEEKIGRKFGARYLAPNPPENRRQ